MNMTKEEMSLFLEVMSDENNKNVRIERTPSKFRVCFESFGGIGSRSIVYSLSGSMAEGAEKIQKLEKALATE